MNQRLDALRGEDLVRSHVDHDAFFQRRSWLEEKVETALADPGCRFVLVLGEPGAGKTGLLAGLARRHPEAARYFIRRNSRTPLNSGDAQSMLLSVGHQLALTQPELFETDRLEVVVRQQAARVRPGGSVVGIRVDDLKLSPFRQTTLSVDQEVGELEGTLVGLTIGTLSVDERVLAPSVLQHLALIEPARLLATDRPEAQLVVLIDALDELRFQDTGEGVLGWLAACLELPPNVRIVLTSRYDDRLLAAFRHRQREWLREIEIEAEPKQVERDLLGYAAAATREALIGDALRGVGVDVERFVAGAVDRADGNFLYLATLCRSVESAAAAGRLEELAAIADLDALPSDLADLYAFFLVLIRDRVATRRLPVLDGWVPAWEALYQPVLGLLTVAKEPLTAQVIAAAALPDTPSRWAREALDTLRPFLELTERGYQLYHATLAEYLSSARTRDSHPDLYLEPAEWHRMLGAAALRLARPGRVNEEGYLVRYGARHVIDAIHAAPMMDLGAELVPLLTNLPLLEERLRLGPDAILEDLHEAEPLALDDPLLKQVRVAMDRQARHLRRTDLAPEFLAQQLLSDAVQHSGAELRSAAARRLEHLGLPWWETRWMSTGASSALQRVIEHPGVFEVTAARTRPLALSASRSLGSSARHNELALWNLDTGVRLALLKIDEVSNIMLTSDGELAVVSMKHGPLRVLRLPSGEPVNTPHGFELPTGDSSAYTPVGLALTPDDATVVVRVEDRLVALFELATGRWLSTLEGWDQTTTRCALNSDGSLVIAGGKDGRLHVWEVPSGQPIPVEVAPVEDVTLVATSAGVAVGVAGVTEGAEGRHLAVWDLTDGRYLHTVTIPHGYAAHEVVLTPDGEYGALGAANHVYGFATRGDGNGIDLGEHEANAIDLMALPDGRILSGSHDDTMRLWNPSTPGSLATLTGQGSQIWHVTPAAGGRVISSGSFDWFCVWDLAAVDRTPQAEHHRYQIQRLDQMPDGTVLSSARGGKDAHCWRMSDGLHLGRANLDGALTRDRQHTTTTSGEPMFGLTQAAVHPRGKPGRVAHTGHHQNMINDVAVDAQRQRIVTVTDRGLVWVWPLKWRSAKARLWRRPKPVKVVGHPHWISRFSMADDGRRGVLVWEHEMALAWDIDATEPLLLLDHENLPPIGSAAISANGAWCVCAGHGVLTLWDLENYILDNAIRAGSQDWMYCWYVAPDGSYALTSNAENLLRWWDFRTGAEAGTIAFESRVVAVLANGDVVIVGTLRGDVIAVQHHPGRR